MRLYSFVNFYLSPLQHGLQTAHCVSELSCRYGVYSKRHDMYKKWAEDHKTIIILNGGNAQSLEDTYTRLVSWADELEFPVVKFHEDERSLNGALTSVACVLPEDWYGAQLFLDDRIEYSCDGHTRAYVKGDQNTGPIFELLSYLKSHRLA